ncbi:hypothetical protein [Shewanella surugensis]|uniref:DUF4426 domain-containing protein n=1 Tax=Shewanella surugensis TaxID=212020 RepID=A0ABT0L6H5_9GAMM|nr:hypothetical protein [Shewanella surugensis]MCL1123090.1 hypothetical protein [Shewanella surugensis]
MRRWGVFILLMTFSDLGVAGKCQLPVSLNGLTLLIRVNGMYSPNNVLADMVLEYVFEKKSYQVTILNTKQSRSGIYQYRQLTPMLARFSVLEGSKAKLTVYSNTFVCETDTIGYTIFSQKKNEGVSDIRQNTGVFIIQK